MYYLGIDLGGTKIAAGLVTEDGQIVNKQSMPTYREREYHEIVKDMALLCQNVMKEAQIDVKDVRSIGIGSPGVPNHEAGTIEYSCNLQFSKAPLRSELQKHIKLPVYIENDANCAALAESEAGAGKDVNHSITVTLGTGIGGGVIINRKIYNGFNSVASELGHMVIKMGGKLCTCGRKGCFECYASATALIKQTKEAAVKAPDSLIHQLVENDLEKVTAKTVFDAAQKEDRVAKKVVRQYIRYLAEGLTNIVNIFEPEVIIIGGGISNEGETLLAPLRKIIRKDAYGKGCVPITQICVAQMGNNAGIIGAAMLGKIYGE